MRMIASGWHTSTVFCIVDFGLFLIAVFIMLSYVEDDPQARNLGGGSPTQQWALTRTAFASSLILDFISWLWTIEEEKGRLYYVAAIINGIPAISYGLLASGSAPLLMDLHGRRLVLARYIHWFFTTPAMIFLYSRVSSVTDTEVSQNCGFSKIRPQIRPGCRSGQPWHKAAE